MLVRRIQRFVLHFLLWAPCLLGAPLAFGQASVTLAWNPDTSTGIAGYHLYFGGASQTYTNMLSPGNVTNTTVSGLKPGATYYFAVTAYNTVGLESVYSSEVSYTPPLTNTPPTTNPPPVLPAPWQAIDIGAVGAAGSASFNNGVFTVAGAGSLSGTADGFRFVYQPISGSADIRVQLDSVQNSGSSALAGVMIRESLAANSRYVFMGISPNGSLISQQRTSTGGATSSTSTGTGTPPNIWVRVARSGKSFSSYSSTDGVNWVLADSSSFSMAKNVYFGFAVASGQGGVLNTSVFSSATAVP